MLDLSIVLTFDDGPHLKAGDVPSYTRQVLDVLADNPTQAGILGGFFVQTHVPNRMGSDAGKELVKAAHTTGHVIGIHTGSKEDHVLHTKRAQQGLLKKDLQNAKAALLQLLGTESKYVRAVQGALGKGPVRTKVLAAYQDLNLKHIFWDVDSQDNSKGKPEPNTIKTNLRMGIQKIVTATTPDTIVVLFHDVNYKTKKRANLESYIQTIKDAVTAQLRTPKFTTQRDQVVAVFNAMPSPT